MKPSKPKAKPKSAPKVSALSNVDAKAKELLAKHGCTAAMRLLLDAGADLRARDADGRDAMDHAAGAEGGAAEGGVAAVGVVIFL